MAQKTVYAGLTVALATSLGANAYLAGNVDLRAAIPINHCATLRSELSAQQKSNVEAFVTSNLADEATARFGPGAVTLADVKINGVCVQWSTNEQEEEIAEIASAVCKPGDWTAE